MPAVHRPRETAARVRAAFGPGPVLYAELLGLGLTPGQVRAAVAAGSLQRLRRGVLQVAPIEAVPTSPQMGLDRDRAAAVLAGVHETTVLSHVAAGDLWGLPTPRPGGRPPQIWVTSARHGRIEGEVHLRIGVVAGEDVDEVDGLRCTSLARTALDMARFRPLPEALVVMDAALARVGRAALWESLDRHPLVYGRRGLADAIREADRRSESPLELASRGLMIVARLPRPELQRTLWVEGCAYRLDFLWDDVQVVGEADGWAKLQTAEDLRAEKVREDGLRRRGLRVVRWTSDDVWRRPDTMVQRLRSALCS